MKNNFLILAIFLLLISCGKQAEQIKLDSDGVLIKGQRLLIDPSTMGDRPRNISLLTFPNAEDVENFSIEFNQQAMFNAYSALSYRDRVPKTIAVNESADEKVSKIVQIIAASADAGDKYYTNIKTIKPQRLRAEAAHTNLLKDLVKRHPCYKITSEEDENKGKCATKPVDGQTRATPTFSNSKNCRKIKRFKKKFVNLTDEEKLYFKDTLNECDTSDDIAKNLLKEEEKNFERIDQSKALVLLQLSGVTKSSRTKLNYIHDVVANTDEDSISSKIKLKQDLSGFETFIFEASIIPGDRQTYSVENGGITGLSLRPDQYGNKILQFTLNASDRKIMVDNAALTQHGVFGVRFAGSTKVIFDNGQVRKGTLKIEIDE